MSTPVPNHCENWPGDQKKRCARFAAVDIIAPDGVRVPGCGYCNECADHCITEYRDKLGEVWTKKPLSERVP